MTADKDFVSYLKQKRRIKKFSARRLERAAARDNSVLELLKTKVSAMENALDATLSRGKRGADPVKTVSSNRGKLPVDNSGLRKTRNLERDRGAELEKAKELDDAENARKLALEKSKERERIRKLEKFRELQMMRELQRSRRKIRHKIMAKNKTSQRGNWLQMMMCVARSRTHS